MNSPRNKNLSLKVSKEEYDLIEKKAKENNTSLSNYLRERVFYDVPNIEPYSFEFKMLKSISYCTGILAYLSKVQLSETDRIEAEKEAGRIMKSNGLDESYLKPRTD